MGMQENNMPKTPSLEVSEEEQERKFQEIMKKRREYQNAIQQEVIALEKEQKEKHRRRFSGIVKAAVLVLVAGACFVAFASRSEATRMWWLSSVERIIGKDTGRVVNNDENRMISDMSEHEAIAAIEEKTGIPMPELQYKPQDMVFDGFDYDEVYLKGRLCYVYEGKIIYLIAYSTGDDSSYMWVPDGEVITEKPIETYYATVQLVEKQAEDEEVPCAVAEWTYHNYDYKLVGKMSAEEMEQIILNILY